jgi:hypothetical protein
MLISIKIPLNSFYLRSMYIYNVTVNVDEDVCQQWLKYMKQTHIPDVMKTGCFIDSQILKVLFVQDQGHTYSVQYKFLEMADLERYQKKFATALQEEHKKMFGEKYTAFRTVLQIED